MGLLCLASPAGAGVGDVERDRETVRWSKESKFIVGYQCLHTILGRLALFYYNDWAKHHILQHLLLAELLM